MSADEADGDESEVTELLEELTRATDTEAERDLVRETVETDLGIDVGVFGQVVVGYDRGDISEAILGSVVFGIPMMVEGGTTEVGQHFATAPLAALGTVAFTVAVVYGIVYVSDIQDVRVTRRILGLVPRRLIGVLTVPLVVAVVGLTVWGRVSWGEPALAVGSVIAAHLPMAIGAALGDILPGT